MTTPPVGDDHKVAKAKAAAAKAEAKAMRPWFKKKRILIPGILVLVIAAMTVSNSGNSGNSNATDSSSEGSDSGTDAPAYTPIGTAVADGDLMNFTVNEVTCGVTSIGDSNFGAEAQGEFCLVKVTAENISKEPQYLSTDQTAFDAEGAEFDSDTSAMIWVEGNDGFVLGEKLNPGNSLDGVFVFDIPKGGSLEYFEFKADIFSTGVKIAAK
jgi:hypothetical protein